MHALHHHHPPPPGPCSPEWGGSQIRPEATGYGAVFFAENILRDEGKDLKV